MNIDDLREHLTDAAIVPIMMDDDRDSELVVAIAAELVEAGAKVIEVLFRSAGAPAVLTEIKRRHPSIFLAAGTIMDTKGIAEAEAANADVMVSAGLSPALHAAAQAAGIPLVPGVNTASEVQHARELGYLVQKFYPAWDQGHLRLPEFAAIYPDVRFLVTGSLASGSAAEFAHHANVVALGGTWMCKSAAAAAGFSGDLDRFRTARGAAFDRVGNSASETDNAS